MIFTKNQLVETYESHLKNHLISCFSSRPVEPHAVYKHYGSGESFLFNLNGQKSRKYSWTGSNNFISTGDSEHFAIGGGRGTHGVWFDAKLCEGSSQACDTFGNESSIAGGKRDFIVSGMQLWVLE